MNQTPQPVGRSEESKLPVVAVVGPTASGKTALGVAIARRFGGEVVSADSMQVYTGMDIASAKPTPEEMEGVPHHLIDFLPPEASFSVADYVELAGRAIAEIAARGRLPILVGGTGLYVTSLLDNIRFAPEKIDPAVSRRLRAQLEAEGGARLLERLRAVDPDSAARLYPADHKRILRALEVYEGTGRTMSWHRERSRQTPSPYAPFIIGIRFADRGKLYARIDRRVDQMLAAGLVEEARQAYEHPPAGGAAQAIGHKELAPYFAGEIALEEAVENLKRETRRYAKRQLTWFGRDPRIHWLEGDDRTVGELTEMAAALLREAGFEEDVRTTKGGTM